MIVTKHKNLRKFIGACETFNLLALRLLLKKPADFSVYCNKVYQQYLSLVKRDIWRSNDLFNIFNSESFPPVTVEYKQGGGIGAPLDELCVLAIITAVMAPRRIFEIGTFKGRTALCFAQNSPSNCEIFTLDLPRDQRESVGATLNEADKTLAFQEQDVMDFSGTAFEYKITRLFGNSLDFDFSEFRNSCDIVFIDGAHDYDYVLNDSLNAKKIISPDGIILWHDFGYYGAYNDVTRAVLKIFNKEEIVQIDNTCFALFKSSSQ